VDAWLPWDKSTRKPLIVALWSLNTQGMQHLPLDQRWADLKQCVELAYKLATARLYKIGHDPNDRPLALFVAPEYLMAQPVPGGQHERHWPPMPNVYGFPGDRRHIDEGDKDIQVQRYINLSNTCQGMIMVPGTIAWRKPLVRSGAKLLHGNPNRPQYGQPKAVSRYDKAIGSVQSYAQRQGLGLNTGLSGSLEYSKYGESDVLAPTTQQKLNALNAAKVYGPFSSVFGYLPGDLQYMARNTAYVLLDGQVICKYNKQGDFHEVLVGTDTVHIPGKLDGRFEVTPTKTPAQRPITFALEVCLDHVFQTTGKEIEHRGKVDVHIISSAQVENKEAHVAARDAGYLVHASSNKEYTRVKKRVGSWFGAWGEDLNKKGWTQFGAMSDERPFWEDDVAGFPLQLYQIELDLTPLSGTVEPSPHLLGRKVF
jgi:hypothetical protein